MARKGGLGKGLDALIPGGGSSLPAESGVTYITAAKITPNPLQPRHNLREEELRELADSIQEHGILQPLIVTYEAEEDQYTLIAGERRLRAAQIAGLEAVPVLVRQVTDQERLEIALIENVQRSDLTPLETAEAFRQLNEEFGLSHEEIARQVGKSRVAVTNTLRLLKLPEAARKALAEDQISEGHARALLGLNSPQAQAAALESILRHELNVRQAEELVRKMTGEKPASLPKKEPAPEINALEERLRSHFGTKVTLNHGKKGGSLIIHYYSEEELNSLITQIFGE